MLEISKDSPLPLYYQLKESILTALKNKEFEVGEKLPSERELADYHNVSRMTVKKAVDILVDNGYLVRKQGSGTFVSDYQKNHFISPILSFSKEMKNMGVDYRSKILSFEKIKSKRASLKLNLSRNELLFHLERLRLIENKIFLLENTYLAVKNFPDLKREDLTNSSLFKIIEEKYNINLIEAEAEVEAVILNSKIAEKMNLKTGLLALHLQQYSKNNSGEIIEYTSAYYRNDNYSFKFTFDLK